MDHLFQYSNTLIAKVDPSFVRYMYDYINWQNRLIGLVGPRGVGKTTLVLQHIKNNLDTTKTLYVTAEDFYFAKHRLTDLASSFVKLGGKYLFIDEIHKYPDWSRELKLMYDYHKDLKIVFTGSSILDIKKGSSDLSRRAVVYWMQGLSFREYLRLFHKKEVPKFSLEAILNQQVHLPQIPHPLPLFDDYLRKGYYPFAIEEDFNQKLHQVVHQTMESDIPTYASMNVATGRKLKQLLAIVAQSVPFKPNMSKIAEMLQISRNNIADYLVYLEEAGMLIQLRHATAGIRGLGKVDKIYLDNTNLIYHLAKENWNIGNVRETFFLNQLKVGHQVYSSTLADFNGLKQIKEADSLPFPLWYFGLLY